MRISLPTFGLEKYPMMSFKNDQNLITNPRYLDYLAALNENQEPNNHTDTRPAQAGVFEQGNSRITAGHALRRRNARSDGHN